MKSFTLPLVLGLAACALMSAGLYAILDAPSAAPAIRVSEPGAKQTLAFDEPPRSILPPSSRSRVESALSSEALRAHVAPPDPVLAPEHAHSLTVYLDVSAIGGTLEITSARSDAEPRIERLLSVEATQLTLAALPGGHYDLVLNEPGSPACRLAVCIPGQDRIDLTARSANALCVRIHDPAGYLAQAGFEDGDIVIGSRGEPLETLAGFQDLVLQLSRGESTSVTVMHAGRTHEVQVDPERLLDRRGWGGRVAPTNLSAF